MALGYYYKSINVRLLRRLPRNDNPMLLYNTLTEKKEELAKPANGALKMFVCGLTVYDYPHVGNMRTYVMFDMFARYLRAENWNVFYLQNITDVEDRIMLRAKEEGVSPMAHAKKFERVYHANEKALGIKSVTKYARATAYIPEIVKQVQTLIAKGHAYKIEGDGYYFDLATFPEYGKLAKRTALQAEDSVSRIDESVKKKNKGDFVLWKLVSKQIDADSNADKRGNKKYQMKVIDGEPAWNTELGWGRPGWHIEDTAITEHFFGPQYDLHGGGVDIKFPHHEAEIAQQEAASGKSPLARFWMHAGTLLVNGEKMSKSKGNFVTIADFLKNHSPLAFRYMVASHHYRSPMDYTEELATQTENAIRGIKEFFAKLELVAASGFRVKPAWPAGRPGMTSATHDVPDDIAATGKNFIAALDDDFNTPQAFATAFTLINRYEPMMWRLTKADAKAISTILKKLFAMLGMEFKPEKIPAKIMTLTKKREALRVKKDFAGADVLRKKIEGLGFAVEDTPLGPLVMHQ